MAPWGARIFHWTRPSGASIFHWTLTLASGWALGTAFTEVVFIHSINGLSMQPALNTNVHETGEKDSVLFWRWQPTRDLKRGQVVSLWQPHNPNGTSVKRVVGLEGDIVFPHRPYPIQRVVVPRGHVWVEGDNWRDSIDSHDFGPVCTIGSDKFYFALMLRVDIQKSHNRQSYARHYTVRQTRGNT